MLEIDSFIGELVAAASKGGDGGAEVGVGPGSPNADTLPQAEYCPHCHLMVGGQTHGVCGRQSVGGIDYTFGGKTASGDLMPWVNQGVYTEGEGGSLKYRVSLPGTKPPRSHCDGCLYRLGESDPRMLR